MKRGELLGPRKTSHVHVKLCKKLIYLSVVHKIITVYTIDNKNFSLKKNKEKQFKVDTLLEIIILLSPFKK